ncbi:MAG: sulfate/molybdate ABC transporter ATP-binding protein [Acidimicrobiales bacterium]
MSSTSGLDASFTIDRGDGFMADVSIRIPPGQTAALLGPNGAGKSTTVDALSGLVAIDSGAITLNGRVLDDPVADTFVRPENRRVGVVFQDLLLFEHLTVLENIAFGPSVGGTRREAMETAERLVDRFDLTDFGGRHPRELSGGQAQRVALARALATEPDLLLLDEPLSALDVASRSALRRTLSRDLAAFEGPRLLISHDPTDAFLLADRIHIIEDGRIKQEGTPAEIRRRPATHYAAAVAGTNLLTGTNRSGSLTLDRHDHRLSTSDTHTEGPVLITIHPTAIALHPDEPHGSPRNTWKTTVSTVEPLGDITRIMLSAPVPLGVDVTPGATEALGLAPGVEIWASVKATEVAVTDAG